MKKITFNLSIPQSGLSHGKEVIIEVHDNANIVEALAKVDKFIAEHPEESIFPLFEGYIHNYLQLFINIETETFYEDVGISPYALDETGLLRKFNPIKQDLNFNLYPNSVINLQQDVGC
ncbi:MAG: hypothetical protein ACTSR8_20170 [Promethearchaeota archaeon]